MVKHDCPYEAYGEPCQCNPDFLETLEEDEAVVIYAEDGEEFQEYCYKDGSKVPAGNPIGIEWRGKLLLLENVFFDSRPHPMGDEDEE